MEEQKKNLLKNALGLNTQTANIAGGALTGIGLIGSLLSGYGKTYETATKGVQQQINAISPAFDVEAQKAEQGLASSLQQAQERAIGQAESGLAARGITDKGVAAESKAKLTSGLSGAYAAASAALAKAKLGAKSGMTTALANYKMDLARRQYESMMGQYAAKMGIWGSLGGLGTGLMGLPSSPKEQKEDKNITSYNPKLNLEGF